MNTRNGLLTALTAVLLAALLAVPVLADDDEGRKITVITDEGETFVCHFDDDDAIRMINSDTGEEIFELDLAAIEETLEGAFAELEEALEDFELDVHFDDDDSFVRVASDDSEVVVNIDAILEGVGDAVAALGEIDFVDTNHRFRGGEGMEELEDELDALREEMRELKRELQKERRRNRH
ncbi:hypothetical protein H8E07_06510 [bacterium]|nr:hypothetical protein [bacterium]